MKQQSVYPDHIQKLINDYKSSHPNAERLGYAIDISIRDVELGSCHSMTIQYTDTLADAECKIENYCLMITHYEMKVDALLQNILKGFNVRKPNKVTEKRTNESNH